MEAPKTEETKTPDGIDIPDQVLELGQIDRETYEQLSDREKFRLLLWIEKNLPKNPKQTIPIKSIINDISSKLMAQIISTLPKMDKLMYDVDHLSDLPDSDPVDNRVLNVFSIYNIQTLFDLVQYTRAQLLDLRGFGKKSLRKTEKALKKMGLRLAEEKWDKESGKLRKIPMANKEELQTWHQQQAPEVDPFWDEQFRTANPAPSAP